MATRVIPPLGPFLPEDIARIRTVYKSLPTWRESDGSIDNCDLGSLWSQVGWPRTDEHIKSYQEFWKKSQYKGRAPVDVMIPIMEVLHTTIPFVRAVISASDKNGDGFIQKDEYDVFFDIFALHYPEWDVEFEKFTADACTCEDGRVSIDEAVDWVEKWVADKEKSIE